MEHGSNERGRDLREAALQAHTRRHFFRECRLGLGSIALASLLAKEGGVRAAEEPWQSMDDSAERNPMAPRPTHYAPKAKSIIYLFMAGGPSHIDTFDFHPAMRDLHGQELPDSVRNLISPTRWRISPMYKRPSNRPPHGSMPISAIFASFSRRAASCIPWASWFAKAAAVSDIVVRLG